MVQSSFDDIVPTLAETTFVVVDLETTGGSAQTDSITEFGAVKVRGGEVLGEFQSLVNPGHAIPPFIAVLTGITDTMVAGAPPIEAVLPAFLEFAQGSVLVAHNAPFDVGFLTAACKDLGLAWPGFAVVDTARLARRVVHRDEAPNCKLATLATLFRADTTPTHRALEDARATVDVLHGLLARLGNRGVTTLEDVRDWERSVSPAQETKRHLAGTVPAAPGVYSFIDAHGERLYVGKSTNMRTRVRTYFTASERRRRMVEMVGLADRVESIECSTPLEAEVRELRLIAQDKPRYNRRSKFPERALWLKLTNEPFPRLSIVSKVRQDAADYLGPFRSRRAAEDVAHAIGDAIPLRQCTQRLSPNRTAPSCVLLDLGRCDGPCQGLVSQDRYAQYADATRQAMLSDPRGVSDILLDRIERLSTDHRFEEAATERDRLAGFLRTAARQQALLALAKVPTMVAAAPRPEGRPGWEIHVIKNARLAAAGVATAGQHPVAVAETLTATADVVEPHESGHPAGTWEEAGLLLTWLRAARLIHVDGEWSSPVRGAGGLAHVWQAAATASSAVSVLDDARSLRPEPLAQLPATHA